MLYYQLTGVIQLLSKCSFFSGSGGKRAPNKKEILLSYAQNILSLDGEIVTEKTKPK